MVKKLSIEKVFEFLFLLYVFILPFGHFTAIRFISLYVSMLLFGYLLFSKRLEYENNNLILKIFIFYVVWSIFSVLVNEVDILRSIKEMKNNLLEQLFIAIVIVSYFDKPKLFEKLIFVLVLSYLVITISSVIELLYYYFNGNIVSILNRNDRGVFHFWGGYARISAIYLPIMIGYFIYKKNWTFGGIIFLISFGLILLYKSASIIVFLSLVLVIIALLFSKNKKIIMISGLLILGGIFLTDKFILHSYFQNKIFNEKNYNLNNSHALSSRVGIWQGIFETLDTKKHILLGYGYGWKKLVEVSEKCKKIYKKDIFDFPIHEKNPHNTYMEILFTTGIVGLISILSIIVLSLVYSLKSNFILVNYVVFPTILSFTLNSLTNGYWEGSGGKIMIILLISSVLFFNLNEKNLKIM